MVAPLLPRAPIDEVVVGFVLDQPIGPDGPEAGLYLAERRDRFTRHETHEPIIADGTMIDLPGPVRTWLISADEAWLIQMQHDRFHANWRRRGEAAYPGFSREGGAMHFALSEFERFQKYAARIRNGQTPRAVGVEMSKIDVLIQEKHWSNLSEAAKLVPALEPALHWMGSPTANVSIRTQERVGEGSVMISITPAQMKADPSKFAFRLEFRTVQAAGEDLLAQLRSMNGLLNASLRRVIPEFDKRFS